MVMSSQFNALLPLIDRALLMAQMQVDGSDAEGVQQLIAVLQMLRVQVERGTLEPSQGGATLGLSRAVVDWITRLDSPLLRYLAAIEECYQRCSS